MIVLILAALFASFYFLYPKSRKTSQNTPLKLEAVLSALELKADGPVLPELPEESQMPVLKEASLALRGGDYARAAVLLREALEASPDSNELKEALAGVLNKEAVREYKSGDLLKARGLLEEAVTLSGDRAFYSNLAGVRLRLNDLEGAREALEGIDERDKAEDVLLKWVYTRLGDRDLEMNNFVPAIDYLEKALALDPADAKLKEEVSRLKGLSDFEGRMGRAEGGRFLVRFEGGENSTAGHLIGILLEEAYIKIGADLGYYPPGRVEALLYSEESFKDITRSPEWAGAIFDGRIKIPAGGVTDKTEELERVIFHEYTHALVHQLSNGKAPVWLNEGLAQYEEGRRSAGYAEGLKEAARSGKISLMALEGSFMGLDPEDARTAYLLSLSATEYIIAEFGLFSVRKILEARAEGIAIDKAIQSALYLSYGELERSWAASLASP